MPASDIRGDLLVPDAAVEMLSRTITAQLVLEHSGHAVDTRDHDAVRAIAAPVVATELRALLQTASELNLRTIDGLWGLVSKRADQLDKPA